MQLLRHLAISATIITAYAWHHFHRHVARMQAEAFLWEHVAKAFYENRYDVQAQLFCKIECSAMEAQYAAVGRACSLRA